MARHNKANIAWTIAVDAYGNVCHADARLAVLMDIREELQKLNMLLHCGNFTDVPHKLDRIAKTVASARTHTGRIAARVAPKRKAKR